MARFPTVAEVKADIIEKLGLVTGAAVQTYTEPQAQSAIQDGFDFFFRKRFWSHLTKTTYHTLDGTAGVITDNLNTIEQPNDIVWIRFDPFCAKDQIHFLHGGEYTEQQGYYYDELPWDHDQATDKMLQFYPKDEATSIAIRARRKPLSFAADESIVPFDRLAISCFAASQLLAIDGTNPGAEDRLTKLFDQRYQDLIADESSQILRFSRPGPDTFTVAPT